MQVVSYCYLFTDKCPGQVAKFEGRQGVFVEGKIQPSLADVSITIAPDNNPEKIISMATDAKGTFRQDMCSWCKVM